MKLQIEEAMKDVKLQLEKYRESYMYYLDVSNTDLEDKWVEELYHMLSKLNLKVAEHV